MKTINAICINNHYMRLTPIIRDNVVIGHTHFSTASDVVVDKNVYGSTYIVNHSADRSCSIEEYLSILDRKLLNGTMSKVVLQEPAVTAIYLGGHSANILLCHSIDDLVQPTYSRRLVSYPSEHSTRMSARAALMSAYKEYANLINLFKKQNVLSYIDADSGLLARFQEFTGLFECNKCGVRLTNAPADIEVHSYMNCAVNEFAYTNNIPVSMSHYSKLFTGFYNIDRRRLEYEYGCAQRDEFIGPFVYLNDKAADLIRIFATNKLDSISSFEDYFKMSTQQ